MKEVENGSKPGLDCTFMFEMFFWTVEARVWGVVRVQVLAYCCVKR
jgi:hypothetical protein